jgi:hypothetical protein
LRVFGFARDRVEELDVARNRLERPRQRARGHDLDTRLLPLRSSAILDRKLGEVLKQRRHALAHAWTDEATYVLFVVDSPGLTRSKYAFLLS